VVVRNASVRSQRSVDTGQALVKQHLVPSPLSHLIRLLTPGFSFTQEFARYCTPCLGIGPSLCHHRSPTPSLELCLLCRLVVDVQLAVSCPRTKFPSFVSSSTLPTALVARRTLVCTTHLSAYHYCLWPPRLTFEEFHTMLDQAAVEESKTTARVRAHSVAQMVCQTTAVVNTNSCC
jgi:hypothetical protein